MKRTKTHSKLIVLTNDPSITAWGYAVLNAQGKVLTSGCIKTEPQAKKLRIRKGDDTIRRVSEINQQLLSIIKQYEVSYLLSELPHGSQNAAAARMIGIVTGIVQTISDVFQIGVEWYSENDAKKAVSGKRNVTKQQMIEIIKTHYQMKWTGVKYKDEAVADALAIHYTACQQSSVLQFYKIRNHG